jgi:hypothetical protein
LFRAELSTLPIVPVITEPEATALSLVAPTGENSKRPIMPIAKMNTAGYFKVVLS